jgi:catechol 2,3-dioxygenase-like lactoylglutathione lyase family enzyme
MWDGGATPDAAADPTEAPMSSTDVSTDQPSATPPVAPGAFSLEVVVIPVSDVDRAKQFYVTTLGWRLDADVPGDDGFRVIQVTPPGSPCSVIFGSKLTNAVPGSSDSPVLVVADIVAARDELVGRGVEVSEAFHDAGGVFHHAGTDARVTGPDPQRGTYGSFASFSDPDGNGWMLQEITTRLPGR